MSDPAADEWPEVAVAVVCICGGDHLARCLEALCAQEDAPPFEVVVRHDPRLTGLDAVGRLYPKARVDCDEREQTPLALAAAALRACAANVILLTEDHCVPGPRWVRSMLDALGPGRCAVGGRVEIAPGARAVDWAFYFTDFFRYASPVYDGPSASLTVCNVGYSRHHLDSIAGLWSGGFDESTVHHALRRQIGPLWMTKDSYVIVRRSVSLPAALAERYAFGRIFGCTRATRVSPAQRWLMAAAALALPVVLIGRMARKALRSSRLAFNFGRALPPIVALVLWWSYGEWLGYVTARPPRRLALAPER